MAHYERFIAAGERLGLPHDYMVEKDKELYNLIQESQMESDLVSQGYSSKLAEQVRLEYNYQFQEFFEDVFGEDTWDDRHEIYPQE